MADRFVVRFVHKIRVVAGDLLIYLSRLRLDELVRQANSNHKADSAVPKRVCGSLGNPQLGTRRF